MDKAISAADAHRKFLQILRRVREGRRYVVTRHGRPVARILPAGKPVTSAARTALLSRLESQAPVNVGLWTRGELYEDGR